jgi:hypothetical protein
MRTSKVTWEMVNVAHHHAWLGYDSWPHTEGFDYPVREDHDISARHALHINHFWKLRYAYPNYR